jgi:2-keto-4-pentenoate hydratase
MLAAAGSGLKAGQFIITGAVVPPIAVEPGEDGLTFAIDPVGSVSVRFE